MGTRVFDLHCDTLDRLGWPLLPADVNGGATHYAPDDEGRVSTGVLQDFRRSPGHLSLEGMSGFDWCQCLAVFIPDELDCEQSARFFDVIAGTLPQHAANNPDLLAVARSASQIEGILDSGRTCGLLTIENGKLLAARPEMFDVVAAAGVKMVTLTWNAANPLGSGHDTEQGLTDFGRKAIRELEARRIAVDVSHLNDAGFADVAACARRPFVASHSNSRAILDVPRNLTDDQFRAIRDSGGIVGLNFCRWFVSKAEDPTPQDLLSHVEHWLDLDGADTVALGTDYDGCSTPTWLAPCERMSDLVALLRKNFGDDVAERICYTNAHNFFCRNESEA